MKYILNRATTLWLPGMCHLKETISMIYLVKLRRDKSVGQPEKEIGQDSLDPSDSMDCLKMFGSKNFSFSLKNFFHFIHMLRILRNPTIPLNRSFSSTTYYSTHQRRSDTQIKDQRARHQKFTKLDKSRHLKRLTQLTQKSQGRSLGGQTQLLDSRMRRSQAQKDKFQQAREFVQRRAPTLKSKAQEEARLLRQRSRQLKQRGTPGLGFTPARFRLMPVESQVTGVRNMKELREQMEKATWDNLGLRKEVREAVKQVVSEKLSTVSPHLKAGPEDTKPTEIQALGIPEILKPNQSVFLAAETGSGKTLAYALPLISQLKQQEEHRKGMGPRLLVVVPSRELVKQVVGTFKTLAHHIKFRTFGVHLGVARRSLRTNLEQTERPIDVLVSTPAAVLRYMQKDPLFSMKELRYLVVDEADSLMDSHSFGKQTQKLLDLVVKDKCQQAVFVSATLPKLIQEQIVRRFPDTVHVTTPSLHRAPQKLVQNFIDVSKDYQGHRLNALWYVLKTAASDKHIIVFCNNRQHANLVHRELGKRGMGALLLAGETREKRPKEEARKKDSSVVRKKDVTDAWERATWYEGQKKEEEEPISGVSVQDLQAKVPTYDRTAVLQAFVNDQPIPTDLLPPTLSGPGPADSRRKILVCTDIASRGLDTTCVSHVILFDFPTTAIDYLHRSGRTARAGSRGRVTALVGKRDRRLADQIRLAIRQGGIIG